MKIPSILDLEKFSIREAIEYVMSLELPYTAAPKKPSLKSHTSTDATEYAEELKQYEKELEIHTYNTIERRSISTQLDAVLEEYIKQESGFYSYIPENKQDKVWAYAWQQGHSSGYSEVYNYLIDLIDLFE